jgi:hypothetical protein
MQVRIFNGATIGEIDAAFANIALFGRKQRSDRKEESSCWA